MIGKNAKGPKIFRFTLKKRAFGATNLNEIFTWVYASYVIHNYIWIHTGGGIHGVGSHSLQVQQTEVKHKYLYRVRVGW